MIEAIVSGSCIIRPCMAAYFIVGIVNSAPFDPFGQRAVTV
jgi:hypothetical protein